MSNNKAPWEDEIQIKMVKYCPLSFKTEIVKIMNEIFKNHKDTINVGKAILQPLQKKGKAKGPLKHLRGIDLLNTTRKVMSEITLNRIYEKVDKYISQSQAAYRRGRGTSDIICAYIFITAKTQKYKELEIQITGIDVISIRHNSSS